MVSDYELKLLSEPRIILKEETVVNFTYSSTMQPYPGEAFVFQDRDEKIELYRPSMYLFNGVNYVNTGLTCEDVSKEYKKLHPEFSGYAYVFGPVTLNEGFVYSFACYEDSHSETPKYDVIGYNELTSSAGGTIVSGGIDPAVAHPDAKRRSGRPRGLLPHRRLSALPIPRADVRPGTPLPE